MKRYWCKRFSAYPALEGAGVLKNDSRITTWHARKRYAEADSNGPAITGVFLRIYKEKQ